MGAKKIIDNRYIRFLMLISFFEPLGIADMAAYLGGVWKIVYYSYVFLRIISLILVVLVFLYEIQKPSKLVILIIAYELWTGVMSLAYDNYSLPKLGIILSTIGVSLFFDYQIRYGDLNKLFSDCTKIMGVIIFINLVTMIVTPTGMFIDDRGFEYNFLLGYKNRHIHYILPFILFEGLSEYMRKKKLTVNFFVILAVISVSIILSTSTTSLLTLIVFLGLFFFISSKRLPKIINVFSIYIGSIFVSILIVFYGFQYRYARFITSVLGKDVTFTARTRIWTRALIDIMRHPIMGNGLGYYDDIFKNWTVTQMHNMYVDVLYVGGIILLAIFSIIFFMVSNKLSDLEHVPLKKFMLVLMSSYFVLFITEGRRDISLLCTCLITIYYIPEIAGKINLVYKPRRTIKFKIRRNKLKG